MTNIIENIDYSDIQELVRNGQEVVEIKSNSQATFKIPEIAGVLGYDNEQSDCEYNNYGPYAIQITKGHIVIKGIKFIVVD